MIIKLFFFLSFFLSFLVGPLIPVHCMYRRLLLHLITLLTHTHTHIHTHTHTHTLGRAPLDKGSVCRRGLYVHKTKRSQDTSMPPAGFEPAIPVSERLQTHALDRVATGIGHY